MSTWTSDAPLSLLLRLTAPLVMLGALGGCLAPEATEAPTQISVARDSVVVAGPHGFCVDRMHSRSGLSGAFVLLGSCASISGAVLAPRPAVPAVLTAAVSGGSIGAKIAGSGPQLAAYFGTPEGRAALSRSGDPARVKVLGTRQRGGAFFLHAQASDAAAVAHGEPTDTWRVLFDLNGRIVTLSVLALPGKPIKDANGRALLNRFLARVRAASPRSSPAADG